VIYILGSQGIRRSKFESRKALSEAGLHRSIQHGIDGNGNEVAAIVVSGGYEDDRDLG
jgi:hypothetical protein